MNKFLVFAKFYGFADLKIFSTKLKKTLTHFAFKISIKSETLSFHLIIKK
ncbi:hypothetical protein SAMN05660493_01106 [Epilithonimonas bovis DSM 19482]|uniref:Uncharacterized protein n=1 Tax=Epilithonimonas bovis DSM 19482 TaxID=1121284 RepID=A0A1U7PUP6_9FLAO|nr:hypothetical protein SAMN05660493_01106 [Epilithonimonas bovis DSM 19482]